MPTGYTAGVTASTTFREFALRCARNFGALITMRDEPTDAPIPEEFSPSSYAANALVTAEQRYALLKDMPAADADAGAAAEYAKACEDRARRRLEAADQCAALEKLAAEARAWVPPTKDHEGLRSFMLQQIEATIDGDLLSNEKFDKYNHAPVRLTGAEWRGRELDQASRDIRYYREEVEKERGRAANRTAWIKALRASLPSETP